LISLSIFGPLAHAQRGAMRGDDAANTVRFFNRLLCVEFYDGRLGFSNREIDYEKLS
jgi:hypothetical protein